MTKTTSSVQQYIFFIGGILLGVLVSVSLVQNDFAMFNFLSTPSTAVASINSVNVASLTKQSSLPHESIPTEKSLISTNFPEEATDKEKDETGEQPSFWSNIVDRISATAGDTSWMKPVFNTATTAQSTATMATSLSPDPAEPVPKWTPGESNDREVAEDAEIAEESLLAKDSSTSLFTEPRAINRMIKRLRKRQVDMEKKGLDSTLVVEKLAALMSAKLGLSSDLQASSSAARKPFEAASASMLALIPGHAEVTDVSSVMSLLDSAFGSSSNAATSTSTSTPVVVGSSKSSNTLPSTSGKQVRKGDKEAIVFGTPEKTQSLKPFPDNLPKFQDNFPDVNDAALYQSRPHLTTQLPLPYHHQAQRDFGKFSPWIPTVEEAKRLG